MTLFWHALTAFGLLFYAHCAAFGIELVPSDALFAREYSRVPSWTTTRLCSGIGKHTRTTCCGTNPPTWVGTGPKVTSCRMKPTMKLTIPFGTSRSLRLRGDRVMVRDPMLYLCVMTSITVICLTALAGSGRDNGVEEGV
jgi:hypothetical protein